MSAVAEALVSVDCPVEVRLLVKKLVEVSPVVEALVRFASVEKRVATVPTVVEAVFKVV